MSGKEEALEIKLSARVAGNTALWRKDIIGHGKDSRVPLYA